MKTTISSLLAIGLLAGPVAAYATTYSLLNNSGFESTFHTGTYCSTLNSTVQYGNWAYGDAGCSVVAVNGITPLAGTRMLDFAAVPAGHTSSDIYQIVDLTSYAAQIDASLATVDTSAYFNSTARAFVGMALFSWTGTGALTLIAGEIDEFVTDADKSTWQQFGHTGVVLPTGARYLFFGVNTPAAYTPYPYVDQTSLLLHIADGNQGTVPEPGALALLGLGLAGLGISRRRKAN